MKKIGIMTQYCESINYGGNLQAYALTYYLNKNGYNALQISYPINVYSNSESNWKKILRKIKTSPLKFFASAVRYILEFFKKKIHKQDLVKLKEIDLKRQKSFEHFNIDLIPHTKQKYFDEELYKLNDQFDVFITGSDQVFNLNLFKVGYFLNFAHDDKTKFSYAASMALDEIPKNKRSFMKSSLERYNAISVREEHTVKILEELTGKNVELVVDPTLLLDKEDWDKVSSDRIIDSDYIFCYFLGDNPQERFIAKEFGQKVDMQIVSIPMCKKHYRYCDWDYGDQNFPFASPEDFISLISNANYVFTDSFHACIFSLIYKKQFVVFNRNKSGTMSTRIDSLVKLFHVEDRYIKDINLKNVEKALNLQNDFYLNDFIDLKDKSIFFLKRNLGNKI